MRQRTTARWAALGAAAALTVSTMAVTTLHSSGAAAAVAGPDGFSVGEFADPAMEYRPGVRWWWPGGAVETNVLGEQLDYLASHGFGTVEINPFGVEPLAGDEDAVRDIYTDAFYDKLDWAVGRAEDLGITVDLNMGSGWNANSADVSLENAEGNLALGRATLTGAAAKAGAIPVPAPAKSKHYSMGSTYDPSLAELQGILLARRTGVVGSVTGDAAVFDDGATLWDQRLSLSLDDSHMIDVADGATSFVVPAEIAAQLSETDDYEVVALYSLPAGADAVDSSRPDWYVVDHMDARKTFDYVNEWVGEANLNAIVEEHDNVRALFNDSLELGPDLYYTDDLYDLAADAENNGIGYDFTKYLPTVYRQNLDLPAYRGNQLAGATEPYLTYADGTVQSRILADFRRLVGTKFAEGLRGFQRATNSYGLQFRQQAYNPPMDIIGAAKYVDIPEEEQHDEYRLRTAASAGHLYGRNLVTAEQYTLGLTPMQNTLDSLKVGIEMMATSGVNNFFYHGFNYAYGEGSEEYGENGWAAFPTIGVNMSEKNTLAPYFEELNTYAARLNYLGQQGAPSMDVAVYAPFNTRAVATGAAPVLHREGYAWDVINDASITADNTTYEDGELRVNGDKVAYDALIVQSQTVPVATMEALRDLADQGAPIVFYGALPNAQDGYADGDFAAQDARVADLARQIVLEGTSTYHRSNETALASVLGKVVDPDLSHATNADVRFVRRSLDDGGELMFLRNIAPTTNTITIEADDRFESFYWLDQHTGEVLPAEVVDGRLTFTLDAGSDALGRGATPARPSNGIALLAEPSGVEIPAGDLGTGTPTGVDRVTPDATTPIDPTSLTVTADNLDGVIGGAVTTETFTDDVLGNWKDATFHGGQLQSVVADGVYTAKVDVDKASGQRHVIDLGTVHTAARVSVNGKDAGQALWAPYEVDVTDLLVDGTNTIEIAVTPRKKNRYYPAATNSDGPYSMAAPQDAGLVGPVVLESTTVSTEQPPAEQPATPVASSLALKVKPKAARAGTKVAVRVRASATGGTVPTGSVTILRDGKPVRTAVLDPSGQVKVRIKPGRPGKHRITVVYSGDPRTAASEASTKVRVKRR